MSSVALFVANFNVFHCQYYVGIVKFCPFFVSAFFTSAPIFVNLSARRGFLPSLRRELYKALRFLVPSQRVVYKVPGEFFADCSPSRHGERRKALFSLMPSRATPSRRGGVCCRLSVCSPSRHGERRKALYSLIPSRATPSRRRGVCCRLSARAPATGLLRSPNHAIN
jgi:hypothetical protein